MCPVLGIASTHEAVYPFFIQYHHVKVLFSFTRYKSNQDDWNKILH